MTQTLCITTSFDEKFDDIGRYSAASIKAYTSRFGFSHRIDRNFNIGRPPAWRRITLIPELFDEGFDYVMWIDADAIFSRFDFNILDAIDPGKDLHLVEHTIVPNHSSNIPNSGVMLVKNSQWSRDLFDRIWRMDKYIDHPWWENAALIEIMGYRNLIAEVEQITGHPAKVADDRFSPDPDVMAHISFLSEDWNFRPNVSRPSPHPIVTHFAGYSNSRRRRLLPATLLKACFKYPAILPEALSAIWMK